MGVGGAQGAQVLREPREIRKSFTEEGAFELAPKVEMLTTRRGWWCAVGKSLR